jgi:predicted MPP superfamily phosphohydrolase
MVRDPKKIRRRIIRAAAWLGILAVASYARWVEPAWIDVTRHAIDARLATPLKIAQLSDLHTRGLGRAERNVLAVLDAERPDAIVVTGDTVSDSGNLHDALPVLSSLHAPLGVFVVSGNWEYWRPSADEDAIYRSAGVRRLGNVGVSLRGDAWLVGLDDALAGSPDPNKAFAGSPPGIFTIAIFHSPALYDSIANRCDLALAGHTHGGQVRIPFLGAPWLPPGSGGYRDGWYSRGRSRLYVNRGIGMSVLAFRFACRPEVALFELR